MSENLAKRLIVSAIGIPVLVFVIYRGSYLLYLFCLLVAVLGAWELAALLLAKKILIGKRLATILSIVLVSMFQFSAFGQIGLLVPLVIFILAGLLKMIETGTENYTSRLAMALLAAVYPGFFISFAILLRREFPATGWILLLFVFVNTWVADTFAYAFGTWFGKRKLAPSISPGKTWMGFFWAFPGGLIAALAAHQFLKAQYPLSLLLLASISATLFGQVGDLLESAIKRDCGAKDSSNLIPGHGGVLDRFDSLLLALPAVYFTVIFLG
jgi:phosphatidate cytidylyltransferase